MNEPNKQTDAEKAEQAEAERKAAEAAQAAAAKKPEAPAAKKPEAPAEPKKTPAWQLPDYAGPLDINQAQWRLANLKAGGRK